jgi:hypothetical protein
MLISLAVPVRSPVAAASDRLFSAPENSAATSPDRRLDTWVSSLQQENRTYLGRGIMKTTLAPPTKAKIFSICFMQFLNAEGGGLAEDPQTSGIAHPLLSKENGLQILTKFSNPI